MNPHLRTATIQNRILHTFLTAQGDALYTHVLNIVLEVTDSLLGIFAYIDDEGAAVAPAVTPAIWCQGETPHTSYYWPCESWTASIWAGAVQQHQTYINNGPHHVLHGHQQVPNSLVVPIAYLGEVIGYFLLANRRGSYGAPEQTLVEQIAAHVAPVLHARLHHDRREAERARAEAALRESEARYRRLAETTEAALWEYDNRLDRWAYVAPQMEQITGWPPEAWTNQQFWLDHLHPEDREKTAELRQTQTRCGEPHVLEYRFRTPQGAYVWLRDSATVELGSDGPGHLRGFMINANTRKQAEQESARNEARLRSLVDILQRPTETLQELLDFTLRQALTLTGSTAGYIYHYDDEHACFTLHNWAGADLTTCTIQDPPRVYQLAETGIWGEVVRQRKGFIINDFHAPHPLKHGYPEGHVQLTRYMTVPVFSGEQIVAAIGVGNKESDYTDVDMLQLTLMMDAVWKIVDRRRAQEALAQERRLLRTVIDNLPDTIYAKDRQRRKTLANQADLRAIGARSETGVLGKTDQDLFPPEVAAPLMADDRHVLETGEPIRDHEEFLIDAHGVSRWLLTSKFPLRDETGEIVGLIGTGRDITDRKRLLAQIETQTRQVQQIIETVPQGVLLLQTEPDVTAGQVLLANPLAQQALEMSGLSTSAPVTHLGNRRLQELLTSPPRGLWHEVEAANRIFEVIARPIAVDQDATSPQNWVLVINDVTQQRYVRDQLQQQERLAVVGQLAAGIAHDFNNIMAVIVLYTQMVSQNPLFNRGGSTAPRAQQQLDVIKQQAQCAAQLIQQILDFSRRAMLDRQPLDLVLLLREQVKLLKRMLPESITINFIPTEEAAVVNADPTRLQQMVMNLAINARDAMPKGGELRIELQRLTLTSADPRPLSAMESGEWISLTVADTGTGIDPSVLPHLYEPFFTTKAPGQGAGLGLPQVHGIVGQHGGHIEVQTKPSTGTTFTIYLPALDTEAVLPASENLPDLPRGAGQTILVVEDNDNLRRALCTMLNDWGYTVREGAHGVEALALIAQAPHKIALVLSDVVMPEMDGTTLVRELRARGWSMPVILLSGHPRNLALSDTDDASVVAWLPKPPALDQLAHTLAAALDASTYEETES